MSTIPNPRKDHLNDLTRALTGSSSRQLLHKTINDLNRVIPQLMRLRYQPEIEAIIRAISDLHIELSQIVPDVQEIRRYMTRIYHNAALAAAHPQRGNYQVLHDVMHISARGTRALR